MNEPPPLLENRSITRPFQSADQNTTAIVTASEAQYWLARDGAVDGPYSFDILVAMWERKELRLTDQICTERGENWIVARVMNSLERAANARSRQKAEAVGGGGRRDGQARSGPARAGWILLFVTCGISVVPFVGFGAWIIAVPVLLTTFILSIIVLSRGGTAQGLLLLVMTIIGAPLFISIAPLISTLAGLGSASSHTYPTSPTPIRSSTSTQPPLATPAPPPATSGDDSWNNLIREPKDRKRQGNPEKPDQTPNIRKAKPVSSASP